MKTVGQILQAARNGQKIDLKDVARITKIRSNFLAAIEADDYAQLPSGTVAKGFIRNYSEFLGLHPESVQAVFRRDFAENDQGQIVPRGLSQPVSEVSVWTPPTTLIAGITLVFTVFVGYLFFQYLNLTGPPSLKIFQPLDKTEITDQTVEVSGATDPEATISVNGQLVALEKGGLFSFRLPIINGENKISVTATSKYGKTSIITRTVIRK